MKIRAALIVSLAALTGCQQKPLAEYTSADGKFQAVFPGEPKVTATSAAGIVLKMYMVESWNKAYMIGWADMPIPEWESEGRTKSRLFDARDGALAAVNGTSNGTTTTILLAERFPGIEFGGTAEGKHLRARVYLVGRRLYQVLLIARSDINLNTPEAEEFFAAFQVQDADSLLPPKSTAATTTSAEGLGSHAIESTNGRFQASYPVKPKKFTRTIGAVEFTGYAAESGSGSCSVGYANLAIPGGESPEKLRERLDTARTAAIGDVSGTLSANKEIAIGSGRPGQEFTATAGEKHLRGRVYLVGARLYQITVLGSEAFVASTEGNAFLDSFKLK